MDIWSINSIYLNDANCHTSNVHGISMCLVKTGYQIELAVWSVTWNSFNQPHIIGYLLCTRPDLEYKKEENIPTRSLDRNNCLNNCVQWRFSDRTADRKCYGMGGQGKFRGQRKAFRIEMGLGTQDNESIL